MFFFHTLEVEVTNYCNAKCVFCANERLERKRGFISLNNFEKYIMKMGRLLEDNYFNSLNITEYPKVNFCGLGDPLLYSDLSRLIGIAKREGFFTQVVSNGILFSANKAIELCNSGLDKICLSLHSINPEHYKSITGIELTTFLANTIDAIKICQKYGVAVNLWRIYHPLEKYRDTYVDENKYTEFLYKNGFEDILVLGPSEPWERDGVVPNSRCSGVDDLPLWCNKILFSDFIDWQGNVVLCCNDYNRESVMLGNAFTDSFLYEDLVKRKIDILLRDDRFSICKSCRRWPDTEVLSIINSKDIDVETFGQIVSNYLRKQSDRTV